VRSQPGPAVARDAAAAVGWRHYGAGAPPPVTTGIAMPDPAAIVNAGYRFDPPTIGVALTDGVGEIELASVFDPHALSLAARTLAVSADGGPVRSRHGLTFLPRADLASAAPGLDRLLVPGVAAAAGGNEAPAVGGLVPEYVHDRPGFPFDATVADLARSTDVATARWAAKVLELPTDGLVLDGPAWPWVPTLTIAALMLPGAGIAAVVLRRRRGAHHEPVDGARPLVRTP
jgi:hypothetical protein